LLIYCTTENHVKLSAFLLAYNVRCITIFVYSMHKLIVNALPTRTFVCFKYSGMSINMIYGCPFMEQ